MILYRARSLSGRPQRHPTYEGNEPFRRVVGRWFTSDRSFAVGYGIATFRPGAWELVAVEVPDDIVEGYGVAATPYTTCGLSPVDHADRPEAEYILPMFRVMSAETLALTAEELRIQGSMPGAERVRDYILVDAPRTAAVRAAAANLDTPVVDLPLAA